MRKSLQRILDREDKTPDDVPHWIVKLHWESDERYLTPLEAINRAIKDMSSGHCWVVTHVRSGLRWSVDVGRSEEIELARKEKTDGQDERAQGDE